MPESPQDKRTKMNAAITREKSTPTKARKPWVAGLLAALSLGLGHLYCGRLKLAILLIFVPKAIACGIIAMVVSTSLLPLFSTVFGLLIIFFVIYIGQIVWAIQAARNAPAHYKLQTYNHPLVYIGILFALTILSPKNLIKANVVEAFSIPTGPMLPTLEIGDQIFVTKFGQQNRVPKLGEMIVFEAPIEPHTFYIKRVIGLPGDEVTLRNGVIILNGAPISRKQLGTKTFWNRDGSGSWHEFTVNLYEEVIGDKKIKIAQDTAASHPGAANFGPFTVPPGHFFVMGDNRDHSADSRMWGPVPVENIIGRADSIWWSWGKDGLRSERIGKQF
jgi:signal peptidase I